MKNKSKYRFVKSKYRSAWTGIVLKQIRRDGINDLCWCLITNDKNGNKPNQRYIKRLDNSWLEDIQAFDLSHVPKEWYLLT